jgi:citronellol/citronellal dehydrogenase
LRERLYSSPAQAEASLWRSPNGAARDGANIAIAAKTTTPDAKLEATSQPAADEITAAAGRALACVVDVRFEEWVKEAMELTVKTFGGIDL